MMLIRFLRATTRRGIYIADISGLALDQPQRAEGNYPEAGAIQPPPAAGRYNGTAPDSFEFGASKAKALKVRIDPVVLADGPGQGYRIRFTDASFKRFKRGAGTASQLEDYLRAHGIGTVPQSNDEAASLVESTANRVFPFDLDWEAYCKKCEATMAKGMDTFPRNAAGGHEPWIDCPTCNTRLRANARVTRFISTVE